MNTGAWIGEDRHDTIQQTVGLNGLVPLINLLKQIRTQEEGKTLFNKILKLISTALNNIDEIQTSGYLLQSADIWINLDQELQNQYWNFVGELTMLNTIETQKSIHIKIVRDLIQFSLSLAESKDGVCCRNHTEYTGTEVTQFTNIKDQVQPLIKIITKNFQTGGKIPALIDQIQFLGQILTSKTQPCFKLEILKLLKILLIDEIGQDSAYANSFCKIDGVQILLYLSTNSPLDIKSMCLKLIDSLSKHKQSLKIETEIIPFLSANFSALLPPSEIPQFESSLDQYDVINVEEEMKSFNFSKTEESELNFMSTQPISMKKNLMIANDDLKS